LVRFTPVIKGKEMKLKAWDLSNMNIVFRFRVSVYFPLFLTAFLNPQQKQEAKGTVLKFLLIIVSNILVKQGVYGALGTGNRALLTSNQHDLAFTVRK
jgi:hypothetical protein